MDVVSAEREETIAVQSAELRTSHHHFLTLAQGVPIGILETDIDGAAVFANGAWCEWTRVSEEDTLGLGWMGSVEPEDLPAVLNLIARTHP